MVEPLRVQAPDAPLARALVARLRTFRTEVEQTDDGFEVAVTLAGDVDRAVVDALNGIDVWLLECGVEQTRVRLHGQAYTLTPRLE